MIRFSLVLSAVVLFTLSAYAIPQTFVSASGNNLNTCERTAPCKTFAGALAKTDANGEIVVLDAGEYGPVTINKSVRITAVGVYAGITAAANNAVTINVAATDVVALRGLTLTGKGATHGVMQFTGGTLHVEDCTISGFSGRGINFRAAGQLFVKDTIVRNNGGAGILVYPASGSSTASIDNCRSEKNGYGVHVQSPSGGSVEVTVRDSVAANSDWFGFYAYGANAQMNVFDSEAVHNVYAGFVVQLGGINAHNCISSGNSGGFRASDGGVLNIKGCTAANNIDSGVSVGNGGGASRVSIEGCQLINNSNHGLLVHAGAVALISESIVTGNRIGLANHFRSGIIKTFGNNRVEDNETNVAGVLTPVSQM
ncbi:MAG TPA: right-handed parallel beta-helix repeat-containing protein [Pyrinomonadaceae bacterium]|nr:right-handed parallel beta-helix repeat-containing protein [Pyrinomonadaceae bacterium]